MRRLALMIAICAAMAFPAASSAASDAFSGRWFDAGTPAYRRSVVVAETAPGLWSVRWQAYGPDGRNEICSFDLAATEGPFEIRDGEVLQHAISGPIKGGRFALALTGPNAFVWTDSDVCTQDVPGGILVVNGIYGREQLDDR